MGRSTVATLEDAIREAVRKHRKQHGSVIVRDGDVFEAVPMEYITYFNYSSPHEMAIEVYRHAGGNRADQRVMGVEHTRVRVEYSDEDR